jgi:hypothetical protein
MTLVSGPSSAWSRQCRAVSTRLGAISVPVHAPRRSRPAWLRSPTTPRAASSSALTTRPPTTASAGSWLQRTQVARQAMTRCRCMLACRVARGVTGTGAGGTNIARLQGCAPMQEVHPKRSWPRAVGGRSFGKELKGSSKKESEWARGVVMADGGNAPLCHARPSGLPPPPPSRPRTTTPFPNHINTPHTTLVASIHSQRSQYESVVPSFG